MLLPSLAELGAARVWALGADKVSCHVHIPALQVWAFNNNSIGMTRTGWPRHREFGSYL